MNTSMLLYRCTVGHVSWRHMGEFPGCDILIRSSVEALMSSRCGKVTRRLTAAEDAAFLLGGFDAVRAMGH